MQIRFRADGPGYLRLFDRLSGALRRDRFTCRSGIPMRNARCRSSKRDRVKGCLIRCRESCCGRRPAYAIRVSGSELNQVTSRLLVSRPWMYGRSVPAWSASAVGKRNAAACAVARTQCRVFQFAETSGRTLVRNLATMFQLGAASAGNGCQRRQHQTFSRVLVATSFKSTRIAHPDHLW